MKIFILFFSILIFNCIDCEEFACENIDCDLSCTEEFCSDYIIFTNCPKANTNVCQNSSLALRLPSPTKCSCCEHCLEYKNEDEECVIGQALTELPKFMCGPDLTCERNGLSSKCVVKEQKRFHCTNGQCQCLSPETHDYIFGNFPESEIIEEEIQCECAIKAHQASLLEFDLSIPGQKVHPSVARCLDNGQFDPLQCVGTLCYCVDRETGEMDKSITPTLIYNMVDGYPSCFNSSFGHRNGMDYYRECENVTRIIFEEIQLGEVNEALVLPPCVPDCDPNGNYASDTRTEQCNIWEL